MLKCFNLLKNISKIGLLLGKETLYYLYHRNPNIIIKNIIQEICNINMLYIKLFQSIANNQWIDKRINENIIKYTNNVPYKDTDIDYVLLNKLKNRYELTYDNLIPINSGVISLIFKVKQKNNEINILKIKRKDIDKNINKSIEEVQYLINLLYIFPFIHNLKVKYFFNNNVKLLEEQLNFDTEVNNIFTFKEIFKNIDYVVIPQVYPYVTNNYPNVIMMKYIEGKEIQTIDTNNKELMEIYSKKLLKISIIAFMSGFIHGDLHTGNILFLDDTKICLLDFGIVLKVKKDTIICIINIIDDLYDKPAYELSINLLKIILTNFNNLYKPELKNHLHNLLKIISTIIENVQIKSTKYNIFNYFECLNLVTKYIDKHNLNQYDIMLTDDFYKLNLIFFMASSIITKFCDKELLFIMNDVCKELFHTDLI